MARRPGVRCELVTFGARAHDFVDASGLRIKVLRALAHLHHHPAHPIAPALLTAVGDADVVHTHHLRSTPSGVAVVVARAHRRPAVVTDHGLAGSDWFGLLPKLFRGLLAVSQYSAAALPFPPAKTRVVYGGADPKRFAPAPSEPRHGVLFVGRLTPHKGVDRLLRALPAGAALTIAGTGGHDANPPECDYPELIGDLADGRDVSFRAAVDDGELAGLYRRAEVVAVPSVAVTCYGRSVAVSELLGLSTVEAMASATPVVASRIGGLAEVVVDGETGYLVEPGDEAELGARLAELLADPRRARRMGDNARALVLERYTWDACADRCFEAYRELLR